MADIKKFTKTFNGGIDSDTASEFLPINKVSYRLNCITSSSIDGEEGVVTNPKGNTLISIELPEGRNKVIGAISNEENNVFFYALWNSSGYHSWMMYNDLSNSISFIFKNIEDTKGTSILNWKEDDLILGVNIVDGDKLYWTVYGSDNPPCKINIRKIIERTDPGYNDVISQETILAAKPSPKYAPDVNYFTNNSLKSNNVYRNLFKFAYRYIYDDYEFSTFSDFSKVAVPDQEDITGSKGVPLTNNGIKVNIMSGGPLVRKIEVVMQKTDSSSVSGVNNHTDWVSVVVLDKDSLSIADNTLYEYSFYNDHSYLSINQEDVIMPYSDIPDFPKTQEYSGNVLFYGNFQSGFPIVKPDFDLYTEYEDLFVPNETQNIPNNPSFIYNEIEVYYESGGLFSKGWRHKEGDLIVGPDVKSGNIFTLTINKYQGSLIKITYTATLNDTAETVASYFQGRLASMDEASKSGGYTGNVTSIGGGSYKFRFRMWNNAGYPYVDFTTEVTPVNYSKLKDTGNSVKNEKLGSSFRYGLVYGSSLTGKKSLTFTVSNNLISISNLSDLGVIKKVSTIMNIKHKAPYWADWYQVVRTKNLTKSDYIQVLIQSKSTVKDFNNDDMYQDLSIGSLFTYQKIHAETSLNYSFEKGDRLRLLKTYDDDNDSWSINTNVIDYEVINYFPEVSTDVDYDVEVDGTNEVLVSDTPDANNIGSYIRINNSERLIIGVNGGKYVLNSPFTEKNSYIEENRTYPTYTIINRRGVIRIKENPDYPIDIINGQKYALVEVFKLDQNYENSENENYYEIGYKFDITRDDNGDFYHRGNIRDQDENGNAVIKIEGFDNYVRNRYLPTNNSIKNTQMVFTSIEDPSFSDFYVSNLSSYGRVSRIDDARGVTYFKESIIPSQNRIEGTKVNGLSMFRTSNRRDYNDNNGPIERLVFFNSLLYVFKSLKCNYLPVNFNIITDTRGMNGILSSSDEIIPKKLQEISWHDGVGKNPESIFVWGNDIWLICPNSGVILRIQGGSSEVVSTPIKIDKDIRDKVTTASVNGAKIVGCFDPYLKFAVWNVGDYDKVIYNSGWFVSNSSIEETQVSGSWSIVSYPDNGSASLEGNVIKYSPDTNYSGMDYFSYKSGDDGVVRNVCVNVLSADAELEWRPTGKYCVVESGIRTGYVGYTLLEEYDNISQSYTGVTKPNSISDIDYVAPFEDLIQCPIGAEYIKLGNISPDKTIQNINIYIESVDDFNVKIISGDDYSGSLVTETGIVSSGSHSLTLPLGTGNYSIFLSVENINYEGVTKFRLSNCFLKSMDFSLLPMLNELILDQSSIPDALNMLFNSLTIFNNDKLVKLHVINHKITSFNLSSSPLLEDVNISFGSVLSSLTLSSVNLVTLKYLRIQRSLFVTNGYSTSFINSMLSSLYNAKSSLSGDLLVFQYGVDDTEGILPSLSSTVHYDGLESLGVNVIGRKALESVNLVSDFQFNNTQVEYVVNLSQPLTVNITVNIRVLIEGISGQIYSSYRALTIPAGLLGAAVYVDILEEVLVVYGSDIVNVTPNPANGVIINY